MHEATAICHLQSCNFLSSLLHLEMLEVVARLDPLRAAERRVVEVHPRVRDVPVVERHRRLDARVQARRRVARTEAFDLVQRARARCALSIMR